MDQSRREDPKLSEVKAVLNRLQGLSTEPEPADFRAGGTAPRRGLWLGIAGVAIAGVAGLAVVFALPILRNPAPPGADGAPLAAVPASGETHGPKSGESTVLKSPRVEIAKDAQTAGPGGMSGAKAGAAPDAARLPAIKAALETAQTLMGNGRVRAARQQLLAVAADNAPDALWALARSYDPSALAKISTADAPPDIDEAERWYRAWYAAAVKQGQVADSVRLEPIIDAMKKK